MDRRARTAASQGARLRLGTLTLRLADSLVVQSIVSYEYGRLFGMRVKNQNTLVVNLPTTLHARQRADADDHLRRPARAAGAGARDDRRSTGQQRATAEDMPMLMQPEPSFLYSNRSYWYPQAPVSDYATARHAHLGAGDASTASPAASSSPASRRAASPRKEPAQNRKLYVFTAAQPLRYLAFILSRFARAETTTIAFPAASRRPTVAATRSR